MKNNKENKKIKLKKEEKSGLASFIQRPTPDENEVDDFERAILRELKDKEIDSHLHDVYTDKKGKKINVSQFEVKKKPNIFWRFIKRLLFLAILGAAIYFIYNFFYSNNNDISSLKLEFIAPEKVQIGEEFSYKIKYTNPSKYLMSEIELEVQYPDNFIYKGSEIDPIRGNYGFELPDLQAGQTEEIAITGMLINSADSVNLAIAKLSYQPGNFSSIYKKEESVSTLVGGFGYNLNLETPGAVFVNQENNLSLIFSEKQNEDFYSTMSEFDIRFEFSDNIEVELYLYQDDEDEESEEDGEIDNVILEKLDSRVWRLSGFNQEIINKEIIFNYTVKEEVDDFNINVYLEKKAGDNNYVFVSKNINPEVISSDLSISLFQNGSKNDQSIGFSEDLTYTINYSNMGSKSYENVSLMVIIEGDIIDWNSLWMEKEGEISENSIIWTKDNISELEKIEPNEEGEISFSLKTKEFSENFLLSDLEIKSIAQYNINDQELEENSSLSNEIVTQLSSDFTFSEKVMYFNEDNIPVGSGPLPPESGQRTTFRIYWDIYNNINELRDVMVIYQLPEQIEYSGNQNTEVGSIEYDFNNRQIIWNVGYLPLSKNHLQAYFDINLEPRDSDVGKILILSPGSSAYAYDIKTESNLTKKSKSKTTKLEDDEIASYNNSGLIK